MLSIPDNRPIVLSPKYALKASEKNAYIFDIVDGEIFNLSSRQYSMLLLADGKRTIYDIIDQYDNSSRLFLVNFIKKCFSLGILELKNNIQRIFVEPANEPHLMSVHWEITNRCNLRCNHCYQERYFSSTEVELEDDNIFKVIDDLSKLNVMKISISGGEPFLRPYLFEILRYIEKKDIRVMSIYTNGTTINDEILNKLSSLRSDVKLFFSLDGLNYQSMKLRFPNKTTFNKLIRILSLNIMKALRYNFFVTIISIIHNKNISYITELYDWLKKSGVQRWRICPPFELGRYKKIKEDYTVSTQTKLDAYYRLIDKYLKDREKNLNIFELEILGLFRTESFTNFRNNSFTSSDYACDYDGKRNHICIKPNGDVTPCAIWINEPIGNLRYNKVSDLWYSHKLNKTKNIKINQINECKNCRYIKYCGGGCRFLSLLESNSLYNRDSSACTNIRFIVNKILPLFEKYNIDESSLNLNKTL